MSFEQTIDLLASADNNVRNQAEQAVMGFATSQPVQFTNEVLRIMVESPNAATRTMCSIVFRRSVFNKVDDKQSLWHVLPAESKQAALQRLLQSMSSEPEDHVRKTICDIVATTYEYLVEKKQNWIELPQALFQLTQSPSASHRIAALEVFALLPTLFDENARAQHANTLRSIFVGALTDSDPVVAIAGLKALVSFIIFLENKERNALYSDVPPHMIQLLVNTINKDESQAQTVIAVLIDAADEIPAYFAKHLNSIIPLMISIVNDRKAKNYEDATAHLALEFVLVLAENKPEMILKHFPGYVELVFPACLSLMVDVEEDPSWFTVEELADIEMDANDTVGEQGLDRIAVALSEHVLPVALPMIVQMLQHQQWQYRHAGLLALGAIAEGTHDDLINSLKEIVPQIVIFAQDQHPRVRHALCNCLGQFCLDFKPSIQEEFASVIVPALVLMMENATLPRIQNHSAAALVNFCDDTPRHVLEPYLDTLLQKLLHLLQTVQKRYAIEQTLDTIATIADAAGNLFVKYYSTFVPLLKNILIQPIQNETRVLRAKAMECVTLIGIAVGKEIFINDAREIMQLLLQTHGGNILDSTDPQTSYLISAYGRIGATLKEDFVPYLQYVMPALLHSAGLKPELQLLDDDDDEALNDEEWEVIQVDKQRLGIKTTVLEEKLTAVEMLFCFAKELGPSFAEYAVPVLDLMLQLFKFFFDDQVRAVAAGIIGPLFESLKLAHADKKMIFDKTRETIMHFHQIIEKETVEEMHVRLLEGYRVAVGAFGEDGLSDAELNEFMNLYIKLFLGSVQRSEKRYRTLLKKKQEDDAEEVENLEEIEGMLMRELSDTFHAVYKNHPVRFTNVFKPVANQLSRFITPAELRTSSQRVNAICAFDDVLEFAGAATGEFVPLFLQNLIACVTDYDAAVRQAASYGMGIAAQFGGPAFAQTCADVLQPLITVVSSPQAQTIVNKNATENAISAIGKICQYNSSKFNVNQVLPIWLSALPITEDPEEANSTYSYLTKLIEENNPIVLGADNSNLPLLVYILAKAVASDVLEDFLKTKTRVVRILSQINNQVPPAMRELLWARVDQGSKDMVLPLLTQ